MSCLLIGSLGRVSASLVRHAVCLLPLFATEAGSVELTPGEKGDLDVLVRIFKLWMDKM